MKIAQISPLIERVPPKKYGGTERVVSALTEELVRRGHEVTLFASGDSVTSARLASVFPSGLREAQQRSLGNVATWTLLNIGLAYSRFKEFDVIHDHTAFFGLSTGNICPTPVIMTMHGLFDDVRRNMFMALRRPYVVTISRAQAALAPELNHLATVYNGLPMEHYPFAADYGEYLLFVGRISKDKGVHYAIDVAEALDLPLIIAAKLDFVDMAYFREHIKPRLSKRVRWIGEVDESERNRLMSRALCFLHPTNWPEPFGLALIEAGACGCPVVAFNRGAIPEVIEHGRTGYVVASVPEMITAVRNIDRISRRVCRARVLERFTAVRMADGYELAYAEALAAGQSMAPPHRGAMYGRFGESRSVVRDRKQWARKARQDGPNSIS